jgi:hypothetical protein
MVLTDYIYLANLYTSHDDDRLGSKHILYNNNKKQNSF